MRLNRYPARVVAKEALIKKQCSVCKQVKSFRFFHKDRRSSTGKTSQCKVCAKKRSKTWYETSEQYREIIRDSGLKHRFGINSDDYYILAEKQNNLCAICKHKPEKYLHVDHNHETGEIRGLLCKNCNNGLGNFKDKIDLLNEAIQYLSR